MEYLYFTSSTGCAATCQHTNSTLLQKPVKHSFHFWKVAGSKTDMSNIVYVWLVLLRQFACLKALNWWHYKTVFVLHTTTTKSSEHIIRHHGVCLKDLILKAAHHRIVNLILSYRIICLKPYWSLFLLSAEYKNNCVLNQRQLAKKSDRRSQGLAVRCKSLWKKQLFLDGAQAAENQPGQIQVIV